MSPVDYENDGRGVVFPLMPEVPCFTLVWPGTVQREARPRQKDPLDVGEPRARRPRRKVGIKKVRPTATFLLRAEVVARPPQAHPRLAAAPPVRGPADPVQDSSVVAVQGATHARKLIT